MPEIHAVIRKSSEGGGTPWSYAYEQDGSLETVVVGLNTAIAALNAVRDRVTSEAFASQVQRIELTIST